MATVWIYGFKNIAKVANGSTAQAPGLLIEKHQLTVSDSVTAVLTSTDFDPNTEFIWVTADADIYFELGAADVTADQTGEILWGSTNERLPRGITKGKDLRLSAILKA